MCVLLARSLSCATEQVIRADRPIAFLSWCFVPRRLDAIRRRRLNFGVMPRGFFQRSQQPEAAQPLNTEVRASTAHVTLINVIEVPVESIDQFISVWKADKDFMIRQPGFIDGTLYRSLQSNARFRFVNVARWKSEDHWKAAIEAGEQHRAGEGIDRLSA